MVGLWGVCRWVACLAGTQVVGVVAASLVVLVGLVAAVLADLGVALVLVVVFLGWAAVPGLAPLPLKPPPLNAPGRLLPQVGVAWGPWGLR